MALVRTRPDPGAFRAPAGFPRTADGFGPRARRTVGRATPATCAAAARTAGFGRTGGHREWRHRDPVGPGPPSGPGPTAS
ncbi:hypothetical protein GCM10010371_56670 [Streptomyces subrutilus]|uniref:Uncharacterized protein n=1 Tax=Streptomyces subrutilus TaxID=36818 RepID=A0A918VDE3_9ACTN|nr:hypothetical protein GCM10010371_56670 [Streptomyces subrutilus]